MDSGIGGRLTKTASGTPIQKFNPPQPRLFATLIEGIMTKELPWGLVILGAVLAVVMQLAGRLGAGVRRRRLPAAGDHAADLRRRRAPRIGRPRPTVHARGGRDQPRHPDVHRPDRRRLAGRHHHRAAGRLRGLRQEDRFLDPDARRRAHASSIPAIGAFAAMAAILLVVGLVGKRPIAGETGKGETAEFGEIGAEDRPA